MRATALIALLGCTLLRHTAAAPLCPAYVASGPVTATRNNQVIRGLNITSTNGPGITVAGFSGVVIDHVTIHHDGGPGIAISSAPALSIRNADIVFDGAPPAGANPSAADNNIDCLNSPGLSVRNVRLTRGSSGIYLNRCAGATLSFIEGHDQRGPFPRGQLVQWDNADHGTLSDFSDENSLAESWTEDNVNVYQSQYVTIRNGLVDTNNSPSGDGVIADNLSGHVLVQNVDAVHQGNGCFGIYGGGEHDVTFTHTRCADTICTLPRGAPLSGSLAWSVDPAAIAGDLNIEASRYENLCNATNIVWDASRLAIQPRRVHATRSRAGQAVRICLLKTPVVLFRTSKTFVLAHLRLSGFAVYGRGTALFSEHRPCPRAASGLPAMRDAEAEPLVISQVARLGGLQIGRHAVRVRALQSGANGGGAVAAPLLRGMAAGGVQIPVRLGRMVRVAGQAERQGARHGGAKCCQPQAGLTQRVPPRLVR